MTSPDPIPYRMSEVPAVEDASPTRHGGDLLSLIFGILAVLCALGALVHVLRVLLLLLGFICALVAVIAGHVALSQRRSGRGLAIAGLVLGYSAIAVLLLSLIGPILGRIALRRRIFRRFFP